MIKSLLFFGDLQLDPPRNTSIRFRAKLIGAVVSAGLWDLATRALTWALSNGFTNFEPVYGSLSSIIALMTWMYLSGYIVFGRASGSCHKLPYYDAQGSGRGDRNSA